MDGGKKLLFVDEAGAADLVGDEVDVDFDAVGDFDEGNAFVHGVVFAVEGHGADNDAVASAFAGDGEEELFGFGNAADGEVAVDLEGVGAGLHEFVGEKGDVGILIGEKEVLALQFAVLQTTSGLDTVCVNLDVQDGGGDVGRGERQGGVPFLEGAF